MIKTFIVAIVLTLMTSCCFAQYQRLIDSLRFELTKAKHDSSRALIQTELFKEYRNTKPDSSIYYGQQAFTQLQNAKYFASQVPMLNDLSVEFRTQGNVGKSMEITFIGLKIAEEMHDLQNTANCLNQLGTTYMLSLQDYPKAIQFFRQSSKIFRELQDDEDNAYMDLNIASAYRRNSQLDSALFYEQKAYATFKELGIVAQIPLLFLQMGATQSGLGNYPLALEYLNEGLRISMEENNDFFNSVAFFRISEVFQTMKKQDSCIWYAQKSLEVANKINFKQQILDATTLLAKLYESRNIDSAYYYVKMSKTANDEINGPAKKLELQKTITDELERQRKAEADRRAYQTQFKQYIFLTGLGIMIFIAFILYRNNKQKNKANKVLEDTLSNLKSTQSQLIQSEKMASLGELTAGIAHEIQNPLNFINNFSEVSNELLDEMKEEIDKKNYDEVKSITDDVKQNLEKILHHGKRADAIVKGMLQHSRTSSGQKETTDINALCDEYLRLSYHGLRAKDKSFNAKFETHFDSTLPKVNVVPQDIGRVILNLINNAFYAVTLRHSKGDDSYQPTVWVSTQKLQNEILISVKDNGPGIPDSIKEKIFQPFFTTKPTGQGTGLGLSLVFDIVKAHDGEIKMQSEIGQGTEFSIQIPEK